MNNWRGTVRSQAEQVIEYYEMEITPSGVETLSEDPVFQELALAHHRTKLAWETAHSGVGEDWRENRDEDLAEQVEPARDRLLNSLRDRAADLLLEAVCNGEVEA